MTHPLNMALRAAQAGESITRTLVDADAAALGSPALIEAVYEAQAGDYTAELVGDYLVDYTAELCGTACEHIDGRSDILDVGTGEANRFIPVLQALQHRGRAIGVDISWSRLSWAQRNAVAADVPIDFAVADFARLPLPDACVDWVISAHALEPNAGREADLLAEMARVARVGLLLIEPDWDLAGPAQRERMTRLGFIGSMREAIDRAGLRLDWTRPLQHNDKAENAASVFVIRSTSRTRSAPTWRDPVNHERLIPFGGGLRSASGLFHPVLAGIPFLRPTDGLMTAKPAPGLA